MCERERERERELTNGAMNITEDYGSSECVREEELAQVKQELAAVRTEMKRRVNQLHSQFHYWLNVTVNILKDHYSSLDTSSM